jgi:TolB-like protein
MYTQNPLRFGTFELDLHSRELRDGSTTVRLQRQPFEILCLMLEHRGTVVTREQLQRRLWPDGTFVDFEHSLNAAIRRLRTALGDDADQPKFVETVPRRGYRLIVAAEQSGIAPRTTHLVVSPRLRLAVLPFSNLSADGSQDCFSDSLTEEMIAQLGPLCRGEVGLIARWSTMAYKGSLQRAREIGEALQADYLLEGSTRGEGSRMRITARLVETASEADRWSETYDRMVSNWLSVQADVAGDVAQSVVKALAPDVHLVTPTDEDTHQPRQALLE